MARWPPLTVPGEILKLPTAQETSSPLLREVVAELAGVRNKRQHYVQMDLWARRAVPVAQAGRARTSLDGRAVLAALARAEGVEVGRAQLQVVRSP